MDAEQFLDNDLRIGFDNFPVNEDVEPIVTFTFENVPCRNFIIPEVKVYIRELMFGPDGKYSCHGIVTDPVDISSKLPLNGWNSHCYADEAKTMKELVAEVAEALGLGICTDVCSWPEARVVISTSEVCGQSRPATKKEEDRNRKIALKIADLEAQYGYARGGRIYQTLSDEEKEERAALNLQFFKEQVIECAQAYAELRNDLSSVS